MSQLINRLPPVLRAVEEMRQITDIAEQPEMDALEEACQGALREQFIQTASEIGVERMEKILGLQQRASASLEERRFAVATQLFDRRPTTRLFLERQLQSLCGENGYTLQLLPDEYRLTVRLALAKKSNYQAVEKLIAQIKPANLVSDLDLLYNRYNQYEARSYGDLSAYQFETLRSEVINVR